jgi:hypothetical protein
VHVPASLLDGWGDVLAADVPLGKRLFVHNPQFPFKPAWSLHSGTADRARLA